MRHLALALAVVSACGGDSGTTKDTATTTSVTDATTTTATDAATTSATDATTTSATDATTTTATDASTTTATDATTTSATDATTTDATTSPDAADATGDVLPMIGEALPCGTRAEVGGLPRGEELVLHEVDLDAFPDALCNDGTGARFFFRPYEGAENMNRWVIQLKGGGGCGSPADCAKRWCSVLTNFGATQMTSDINAPALPTIAGRGILDRRDDNPWAGYNQVFVNYCSSDEWAGSVRDREVETFLPCDPEKPNAKCPDGSACPGADAGSDAGLCKGSPVHFRMHFLGHAIVDAVISTLRRDGVAALETGGVTMPDLDDADYVVFAGASAGGAGVTNNIDAVKELLVAHNTKCQTDAECPLVVDGLIDSIFAPSMEGLDFTGTQVCAELGVCDYESAMAAQMTVGGAAFTARIGDESCKAWHAAHDPGSEWRCEDRAHVIANHLTTPFFVRQGLDDSLLSSSFIDYHLKTADGQAIDTPLKFAKLLQPQLEALATWSDDAEEASPEAIAPGAFGPGCPKHETLSSSPDIFDTTIEFAGAARDMFEVMAFWKAGGSPAVLIADKPADSFCAQ